MNNIVLVGRLTKDIELKYTAGTEPRAVARFNVAIRRDEDHTDFIPCIAFGKMAENCEKFLKKGSQVGIVGRLQSGSYEKEGKKIYTLDVVCNQVEFLTPKLNKLKQRNQQIQFHQTLLHLKRTFRSRRQYDSEMGKKSLKIPE